MNVRIHDVTEYSNITDDMYGDFEDLEREEDSAGSDEDKEGGDKESDEDEKELPLDGETFIAHNMFQGLTTWQLDSNQKLPDSAL